MRYKFYTTSNKAWDGIYQAIAAAQKTIFIEMYIFLADTGNTHDFLGKLAEKARQGVSVIVIADAYGSLGLKSATVAELKAAGGEFMYFSHWLTRTHRKLVIIDEKIAFLGGVNIENKIRDWNDLQIRLTGSVVKPLLRSFAHTYRKSGGRNEAVLAYSRGYLVKKFKAWVVDNWEGNDKEYNLNKYYKEKLEQAMISIRIVTPYLLPPRWLMVALDNAVRRGVRVDIIIPEDTDVKALNKINYINACRLAAVGVNFHFTSSMNHAKAMVIDGREALVGSQNLDILSFGINLEIGVFFEQKEAVAALERIINQWQAAARRPDLSFRKVSWRMRLLMFLFRFFFPIL